MRPGHAELQGGACMMLAVREWAKHAADQVQAECQGEYMVHPGDVRGDGLQQGRVVVLVSPVRCRLCCRAPYCLTSKEGVPELLASKGLGSVRLF